MALNSSIDFDSAYNGGRKCVISIKYLTEMSATLTEIENQALVGLRGLAAFHVMVRKLSTMRHMVAEVL